MCTVTSERRQRERKSQLAMAGRGRRGPPGGPGRRPRGPPRGYRQQQQDYPGRVDSRTRAQVRLKMRKEGYGCTRGWEGKREG